MKRNRMSGAAKKYSDGGKVASGYDDDDASADALKVRSHLRRGAEVAKKRNQANRVSEGVAKMVADNTAARASAKKAKAKAEAMKGKAKEGSISDVINKAFQTRTVPASFKKAGAPAKKAEAPAKKAEAPAKKAEAPAKKESFGAAFKAADKSKPTFTYNGKSYSTASADDVKKSGSKDLREHLNKMRMSGAAKKYSDGGKVSPGEKAYKDAMETRRKDGRLDLRVKKALKDNPEEAKAGQSLTDKIKDRIEKNESAG